MTIKTRRHLGYAAGYLELKMLDEAGAEFDAVTGADRDDPQVMRVRIDLCAVTERWSEIPELAGRLTQVVPLDVEGQILWAGSLRVLNRAQEAHAVLLAAEPQYGATSANLNFNIGAVECILGSHAEAVRRIAKAIELDRSSRQRALDDTDLESVWDRIRALP